MSETQQVQISMVIPRLTAAAERALEERPLPPELGTRQFRRTKAATTGYNAENHTVTMAVSSEFPVERYGGAEVLSHQPGAINLDRLKDGGIALLFNHNYDRHLGTSVDYELKDGVLRITNKFGTNPLAREKEQDVADGILKDVSIGYQPLEFDITEDKNGNRTYTVTNWELYENSLVTVPADPTVGVDRSAPGAVEVKVNFRKLDDEDPDPDDDEEDPEEDEDERKKKREADSVQTQPSDPQPAPAAEPTSSVPTTQPNEQRTQPMATAAVVSDPQAQNKERIDGLRALRTKYTNDYSEKQLLDDISGTRSVSDVRLAIADEIIKKAENTEVRTASEQLFGRMSDKERKSYSLRNVYAHAINQRLPGTFSDKGAEAGLEREISTDLRKDAETRGINDLGGGTLVPSASSRVFAEKLLEERTIASGGNAGTNTNFTTVSTEVIELLRFKTALLAMGARYLPGLHGQFQMPTQTGAATSNWLTEGAAVTSSDPTLGSFLMNPKRMSIANSYFRDFLAQSGLAIDGFLASDRQAVTARSLDTAGFIGTGVLPVPLGLFNRSGLAAILSGSVVNADGTVTAGLGGKRMSYNDYVNLESTVATSNGDIGTMGIITTTRVRGAGRTTPVLPGTASGMVWPNSPISQGVQEGPLGYKSIATTNPALTGFSANSVNNLHAVAMGVWDQLLIGDWDLSEIIVDPYTGAASAMIKITEHAYYDIAVRQLAAFCVCLSALPQ